MIRWTCLLALLACRHSAEPQSIKPTRPEVWIDASALDDGDGSAKRPFKKFRFIEGATHHLADGIYEVDGLAPAGVEVIGAKAVVLHTQGLSANKAHFTNLAVQGGEPGLTVQGDVSLENVSFSAQKKHAVRVESKGALKWSGGTLEGSFPGTVGVKSLGKLEIHHLKFIGALHKAIVVESGTATVDDSSSEGPATLLNVSGGEATVKGTRATGGRNAAFAVTGASLSLSKIEVVGHEYAVLAGLSSKLTVDGLRSERAQIAGVSLVRSIAKLTNLNVTSPGTHGAVESLDSDTTIEKVEVSHANELAIWARQGTFRAKTVRIRNVKSDGSSGGDGVTIRDARAELENIEVHDVEGTGVVATQVSTVQLKKLLCSHCAHGALLVERRSSVEAQAIRNEGNLGAAVIVAAESQLTLTNLAASGSGEAVWAECSTGAVVKLMGNVPPRERLSGWCIDAPTQ